MLVYQEPISESLLNWVLNLTGSAKMLKNIKVILIGGSPMSGKTTLAIKLAAKYEYGCISTDDIGEIIGTVSEVNPMKDFNYREYYISKSIEDLINDISLYHRKLWPSIKHLIEIHSAWSTPIIIEGWALYPKLVESIENDSLRTIWLVSDEDVLEQRLRNHKDFYRGSSDEKKMITNYLHRSLWHNETISKQANELNHDFIRVTKDLPEDRLVEKAIEVLTKE